MSTKIYDAYVIDKVFSLGEFNKECRSLSDKLSEKRKDLIKDRFTKESYSETYFELSKMLLQAEREKTRLHLLIDFGASLCAFELNNKTYILFYYEEESFKDIFTDHFKAKDFSYWNNTDKPDEISELDWENRRRVWDIIFDKKTIPSQCGVCFDLLSRTQLPFTFEIWN